MNIVTPYPSNIPINTVNVTTELARRDNQLREMISPTSANQASAAERGVASEHDKAKPGQQNPNQFEANLRDAENQQKIHQREHGEHGHGKEEQGKGQQGKEQSEQQDQSKAQQQATQRVEKAEQEQISQLKSRDAEVRTHEQAHAAVGGQFAGSPTYSFKRGPDGKNYAVGGEVSISTSEVNGDPAATIKKMQQVRAAALAPAEPSGQDRKVAAAASQKMSEARADQIKQSAEERQLKAEEAAADKPEETSAELKAGEAADEKTGESSALSVEDQASSAVHANNAVLGEVFGVGAGRNSSALASNPAGSHSENYSENKSDSRFSAAAEDNRNSAVLARASRVQNFYQAATRPHASGFSQFA